MKPIIFAFLLYYTMATKENTSAAPLRSAPPPWHAVALVALMAAIFVRSLRPAMQTIDEVAVLETFSRRLFPEHISLDALIAIRAAFAIFIIGVSIQMIFYGGWIQLTPWLPNSRLKRAEYRMFGLCTQAPFTVWCWNLLGASCAMNAWLAYLTRQQDKDNAKDPPPTWLLRAAILLFEIVGPCAMLVAFVVKYALWPQALKHGTTEDPTLPFKRVRALIMHNLNVLVALTEISLLGGLPIRATDFGVAVLYGIVYIVFTWSTMMYWAPQHGPQALYFFMDPTLGATTTLALLALLVVLMVFYGLFCGLHAILDHLGGGIGTHALALVVASTLVCRVRD